MTEITNPPLSQSQTRRQSSLAAALLLMATLAIGGAIACRPSATTPVEKPNSAASPVEKAGSATKPVEQASSAAGPLLTKTVNGITIEMRGEFRMPSSEMQIEFKDAQGQSVDVGTVKLALDMNMGGMMMHGSADVSGAGGHYVMKAKPQMRGGWQAKITFNGPKGNGEATFNLNAL